MSGGSYDYFYEKLDSMAHSIRPRGNCDAASPALRKAFADHLRLCAKACRAIEWNDSCDGDSRETDLIRQCLAPDAEIKQAIAEARDALDALTLAIAQAEEKL